MIKLRKLTLKNFKIFDEEPYTIDLSSSNLVLLDGPNGYGKTSVFDAIEVGLTGNISRLIALDSRQNPADIVVAHNGAKDVEVQLEFICDGKSKVFLRKLKDKIPNSSKKISKFTELWDLYEVIDGEKTLVSNTALNTYFESNDFERDFLLYHYVQQEDTSRFLKNNNEVQRAQELAKLFGDTRAADLKLQRLNDVSRKLGAAKKNIANKISQLKILYKIDDLTSVLVGNAEPHFYVFPWLNEQDKATFWDAESIPELNQEKLNTILKEIDALNKLVDYKDFYIHSRMISNASRQQDLLGLYLGYYNAIANYDFLIEQQNTYELINSAYLSLKDFDIDKIKNINNLESVFSKLSIGDYQEFKKTFIDLEKKRTRINGLSSIYVEIIKHHAAMSNEIEKIEGLTVCQLCGRDYEEHDLLLKTISKHSDTLRQELNEKEKEFVSARDYFYKIYLNPLSISCKSYLETNIPFTSEDLVDLNKALSVRERLEKMRNWLNNQAVEHDELLITNYPIKGGLDSLSESVNALSSKILSKIGTVPENYYEDNESGIFDRLYREYFNNNQELLNQTKKSDLEKKENYIKTSYFESLRNVINEIKTNSKKEDMLSQAIIDVDGIAVIIRRQIRQFRKKLITDIEIPFYIYSGKILQTHQAGMGKGIFIKDPTGEDELKNVRFVSNWQSDHDVLNTMSSGQISAVVIALMLALNKVYCGAFSSIFIDDPVQTMDDINMSSLIELLRNDFKGKQLIMSTHEDKVSRFFTYKYLKYGGNVKIINLMERKEYIPSNRYIYRNV